MDVTAQLGGSRILTFGQDDHADIRLHSVVTEGTVSFALRYLGEDYAARLKVAGLHNAINAAGAFGVLVGLGFDPAGVAVGHCHLRGDATPLRVPR